MQGEKVKGRWVEKKEKKRVTGSGRKERIDELRRKSDARFLEVP